MNNTEEQLIYSVESISEYIGLNKKYKILMGSVGYPMPEVVKLLVYDMFLNKFDQTTCPLNLYAYYKIVHDYVVELDKNQYVNIS